MSLFSNKDPCYNFFFIHTIHPWKILIILYPLKSQKSRKKNYVPNFKKKRNIMLKFLSYLEFKDWSANSVNPDMEPSHLGLGCLSCLLFSFLAYLMLTSKCLLTITGPVGVDVCILTNVKPDLKWDKTILQSIKWELEWEGWPAYLTASWSHFLCPRDDSQGALRFAPVCPSVCLSVRPFVTLYGIEFV